MGWSFKLFPFTSTVPLIFTLNIFEEPSKALGTAAGFDAQEVRRNANMIPSKTIPFLIRFPPFCIRGFP